MSRMNYTDVPSFPASAFNVTPSDAVEYSPPVALWVTGAGSLVVEPAQGATVVTVTVEPGMIVPFNVRRVRAATTATVVAMR